VIILSDPTYEFSVLIDAPVHSVFEHCLDPRRIYAGDPMNVADATLIPGESERQRISLARCSSSLKKSPLST